MNYTRIISGEPTRTYSQNFIDNNDVEGWILAPEYTGNFHLPKWNGSEYYESITQEEIAEKNKILVPANISAMALKLQLFDLDITDNDIFADIDSIPDSMFPLVEKEKAKIKYKTATHFDRNNADLNLIATMEGLTQEQVDTIFINGNSF